MARKHGVLIIGVVLQRFCHVLEKEIGRHEPGSAVVEIDGVVLHGELVELCPDGQLVTRLGHELCGESSPELLRQHWLR